MPDPITIISVVILLGIVILVHEWGHFVAAKSFGVRVDVFSIGFGPRIWGWKRGDTDYRLSVLPLGGYVKMAGDNPMEERVGADDEFLSKPRWQRAVIAVAGPAMNIVLAVVLVTVLNLTGTLQPAYLDQPAVVAGVEKGSAAEQAGIQAGDRIVEINGVKDPNWERALMEVLLTAPGGMVHVRIARGEEMFSFQVAAPTDPSQGSPIGYPAQDVLVGRVTPGAPAEKAGLQPDDHIVGVGGAPIKGRGDFVSRIQEAAGKPVELLVRREGQELNLTIEPFFSDPGDGGGARWQIGMGFRDAVVEKSYPLPEAVTRALWFNVRFARQIASVVVELVRGRVSIKQLGGPVEIARQSGAAARRGPQEFVNLMAIISLNLAILNLLPIPILDGGHILMLTIEGALRRDLSLKMKERFVQVGLVFLLVIFAVVMYNDILKTFRP
jgi:regulator of sigma E protease